MISSKAISIKSETGRQARPSIPRAKALQIVVANVPAFYQLPDIFQAISSKGSFSFVKSIPATRGKTHWFFKTLHMQSAIKATSAPLVIGLSTCRVKPCHAVVRCRKCQQFGHPAAICVNTIICERCSGEHDSSSCSSKTFCCSNCTAANGRGSKWSADHRASSSNCPSFIDLRDRPFGSFASPAPGVNSSPVPEVNSSPATDVADHSLPPLLLAHPGAPTPPPVTYSQTRASSPPPVTDSPTRASPMRLVPGSLPWLREEDLLPSQPSIARSPSPPTAAAFANSSSQLGTPSSAITKQALPRSARTVTRSAAAQRQQP